jgi:hypothetical protein
LNDIRGIYGINNEKDNMKILKTASGKQQLKLSKKEWQDIGKKAGWMKKAQSEEFTGVIIHNGNVEKFKASSLSEASQVVIENFWEKAYGGPGLGANLENLEGFTYDPKTNTTHELMISSHSYSEYAGASPQTEHSESWTDHKGMKIKDVINKNLESEAEAYAQEQKEIFLRDRRERDRMLGLSDEEYSEMRNDMANEEHEREMYDPQYGMEEEISREINRGPSRMGD